MKKISIQIEIEVIEISIQKRNRSNRITPEERFPTK